MALSRNRVLVQGLTPHPWEREGIEFLKSCLPDTEPYRMWAIVEFQDRAGHFYEIDALVLGYHALYLLELKGHPGRVSGDSIDWTFALPGSSRPMVRENPLRLANHKAKVLASHLEREMGIKRPWVESLIFLSSENIQVDLKKEAQAKVVTRASFPKALTHGLFPSVDSRLLNNRIDRPTAIAVEQALARMGLVGSKDRRRVGGLLLKDLIEEGPGWQDFDAEHETIAIKRRVRSYSVSQGQTGERLEQLRRAADREAKTLLALGDHRRILKLYDFVPDGPMGGPCLVFDRLEDAVPLDTYLRLHPDLPLSVRASLLIQIGEALAYCHSKEVLHRALHPGAVLVWERPGGELEVRLTNFHLAVHPDANRATSHLSALTTQAIESYLAPEVQEDPARASKESDVFSLGAIAFFVFTGRSPGATVADRNRFLAATGYLSLAAIRNDLGDVLETVVAMATQINPVNRADDVTEWVNDLLEATTEPDRPVEADPLEAKPGDQLGDLEVLSVLGTGATAKVLRVRGPGNSEYALKVALNHDLNDRIREEARILEKLRGDQIVDLERPAFSIHERACLLLTFAGETLATVLAREATVGLDFAKRWGEDLLLAVQSLEKRGVQHRDIKPANLGILPRTAKKKRSLMLFDFSLSTIPAESITAGTPAYRDPFLLYDKDRGRWDEAADRYAAALTLHEMLTGSRPRWGDENLVAATGAEITLSSERFDSSIRDRLTEFFRRALRRNARERHPSAEAMREEWNACFSGAAATLGAPQDAPDDELPPWDEALLAAITGDTPVAALPLSIRAKNALDRAGYGSARELLKLPKNQLSLLRGVGRETLRTILVLLEKIEGRLSTTAGDDVPFFPGFAGADGHLALAGLDSSFVTPLEDAGLTTLSLVATAPRWRISRVLAKVPDGEKELHSGLTRLHEKEAGSSPTTIEAWLDALVPPASKKKGDTWLVHTRLLLGLDRLENGARVTEPRELADQLNLSRQMIYVSLKNARERWEGHPALAQLHERVAAALSAACGAGASAAAARASRVAEQLLGILPSRTPGDPAAPLRAEALIRIVGEVGRSLHLGRINDVLWMTTSPGAVDAARSLGRLADELAGQTPLASSERVAEAIIEKAIGTPLAGLTPERLISLAADASKSAARSARLEIYPAGLDAARALDLSVGALPARIDAALLKSLVASRYPEASPLPDRPELDEAMKRLRYHWRAETAQYEREGAVPSTQQGTVLVLQRRQTTHTTHRPGRNEPGIAEAEEIDNRIRIASANGSFRVVEVDAVNAEPAAIQLAKRIGAEQSISLERELLACVRELMRRENLDIDPALVVAADREGPSGSGWANLRLLMKQAADQLLQRISYSKTPVVLEHPGLLARFNLDDFLQKLIDRAQVDGASAVFLVVPIDQSGGLPRIHSTIAYLPIPITSPSHRIRVPASWIQNLSRGTA